MMSDIKLTHLQRRRLVQLDRLDRRIMQGVSGEWITSHWNSSRAANEKLVEMGFAERYGQSWFQPSGKVHSVGDVRITEAGRQYLRTPTQETQAGDVA